MNKKSQSQLAVQSKEYDMVQYVLNQMKENNISEISWKDFQKRFPNISQRYNKLIQEIRKNKPKISIEDFEEWLWNYNYESKYDVDTQKYYDPKYSFRDAEQLVIQINRNANFNNLITNEKLKKFLQVVGQTAVGSGHPVKANTIGWFRLDKINQDYILIDEIQSDLLNAVDLAKNLITTDSMGDLFDLYPEGIKQQLYDRFNTSKNGILNIMNQSKHHMVNVLGDGDEEQAMKNVEYIKNEIKKLFVDWVEDGLSTVIDYARDNNIKYVILHTPETIKQRDADVGEDKLSMYYTQTARKFGFNKQNLNLDDLKGEFFIRQAKKINIVGIKKQINKLINEGL